MKYVLAAVLMCAVVPASAAQFTVQVGDEHSRVSVDSEGENPFDKLDAHVAVADGYMFHLDEDKKSHTFDFLEFSVKCVIDVLCWDAENYTVTATLAFDPPDVSVDGSGGGLAVLALGNIVGGNLTWSNFPKTVSIGNGQYASIHFHDLFGLAGKLGDGELGAETVRAQATVTLATSPVPLPAAGLMLGAVLGGMGYAAKRRRQA